jgi:hypothetical protein
MTKHSLLVAATSCFIFLAPAAHARSAYDGSWDMVFVTQRGACDSSYSFTVDVTNGIVTHPNLVRFRGFVAKSGAVRASVTVQINMPRVRANSPPPPAAGPGAAAQAARDARAIGRRNVIEKSFVIDGRRRGMDTLPSNEHRLTNSRPPEKTGVASAHLAGPCNSICQEQIRAARQTASSSIASSRAASFEMIVIDECHRDSAALAVWRTLLTTP